MKPIKSLVVLALVLAPALASAQGYYGGGGPPPGERGFHNRMGRLAWGISIGLGGMHDDGGQINCDNCNYNPLAGEADFHIGAMLSPRFALLFEAQANIQTLHSDALNGDTTLSQGAAMIAAQYWLTPIIWIKGGIGLAHLSEDNAYYTTPLSDGVAVMGAVGLELLSARFFAVDLQARIIEGSYDGLNDHVTSGTVGVGLNWY